MKSSELLLSFVFIFMVYLILLKKLEPEYIIGTGSLLFVILWITDDNIMNNIYGHCSPKTKIKKNMRRFEGLNEQSVNELISNNIDEEAIKTKYQTDASIDNIINKKVLDARDKSKKIPNKPLIQASERPRPLEYSENNYKYNLFDEIGSLGDNRIAHLMKHVSNKNRVAIDNMARQNKYTNINYFTQELDDHANSIWWDDETLEKEF